MAAVRLLVSALHIYIGIPTLLPFLLLQDKLQSTKHFQLNFGCD